MNDFDSMVKILHFVQDNMANMLLGLGQQDNARQKIIQAKPISSRFPVILGTAKDLKQWIRVTYRLLGTLETNPFTHDIQ
jgi:hypothetical protein